MTICQGKPSILKAGCTELQSDSRVEEWRLDLLAAVEVFEKSNVCEPDYTDSRLTKTEHVLRQSPVR